MVLLLWPVEWRIVPPLLPDAFPHSVNHEYCFMHVKILKHLVQNLCLLAKYLHTSTTTYNQDLRGIFATVFIYLLSSKSYLGGGEDYRLIFHFSLSIQIFIFFERCRKKLE